MKDLVAREEEEEDEEDYDEEKEDAVGPMSVRSS